ARWVGLCLPLAELGLALLLLPSSTRWAAGIVALALLLAFCAAMGFAMARGKRPECHCFGRLHSEPIGWQTFARNGALIGLALFLVAAGRTDPGPSVVGWTSRLDAAAWGMVALGIVVATTIVVAALAVVHVLRAYGRVL